MKSKPGVSQLFGDANRAKEVYELKQQVEMLQSQLPDSNLVVQLEEKIAELTQQLSSAGGEQMIALSQIDLDKFQPRRTISTDLIQSRSESLRKNGQKTPIILIPQDNGRFLLFDGELRWRSASQIGWTHLRAVFLPSSEFIDPEKRLESQVVTALHSERLNGLDLAEALERLALFRYEELKTEKNITSLLQSSLYQLKKAALTPDFEKLRIAKFEEQKQWIESICNSPANLSSEGLKIVEMLLEFQLNPSTVSTHVFNLLNLPQSIKDAIRNSGLSPSLAEELGKLNAAKLKITNAEANEIRDRALDRVLEEKMSLAECKALVAKLLRKDEPSFGEPTIAQRLSSLSQTSKKKNFWTSLDSRTQKKAIKLLEQLEELMAASPEENVSLPVPKLPD